MADQTALIPDPLSSAFPRNRQEEAKSGDSGPISAVGSQIAEELSLPAGERKLKAKESKPETDARHQALFTRWWVLRNNEPNISKNEAAKQLGVSQSVLWHVVEKGLRLGWGHIDDPIDFVSTQLIPKAMKNLDELLTAKDKRATIETLKGTAFPEYRDSKASQAQPRLTINVQFEPAPAQPQTIIEGQIVGRPKELPSHSE